MASSGSNATEAFPPESTENFEQRIRQTVSNGFIVPCIAIGSKLGLFDKMAEFTEPVTSQQLADAMGHKERYVREWLNSMVSLRVFDYDKSAKTYFFPENRHPLFTVKGGKNNIANMTQGLTLVSRVYHELQTCFQKDGPLGIPYEHYEGFHEWREDRVKTQFSEAYMKQVFENEPGLLDKLEKGMRVCDMGCGPGRQARLLATMYPNSTVHGCDIGPDAIQIAEETNKQNPLPNLSFSVQDVCELPADWSERFDLITVYDVIHDLAYASRALRHMHRALRPGGILYMMDISSSEDQRENSGLLYTMSLYHCMAQSLFYEGSEGLGTLWGQTKAREMLAAAGFTGTRDLPSPEPMFMHMIADK